MTNQKVVCCCTTFLFPPPMNLTATHINYYHICKRKLWLFANGIQMEHTADLIAEGKQMNKIVLGMGFQNKSNITK